MVKVYKMYFYDNSGDLLEGLFRTEEDGYKWGENHGLEFFNSYTHYTSKEIAEGL